jgi:hypothetical protein
VNARDKNFTRGKIKARLAKLEETIAHYLTALDAADRQESMDGTSSGLSVRSRHRRRQRRRGRPPVRHHPAAHLSMAQ